MHLSKIIFNMIHKKHELKHHKNSHCSENLCTYLEETLEPPAQSTEDITGSREPRIFRSPMTSRLTCAVCVTSHLG